jgi:hypothetical protein
VKTLTTPVTTAAAASAGAWCHIVDIYLPEAIDVPGGASAVDVVTITDLPGGLSFFTPKFLPEPSGSQGDAQAYTFWPFKRGTIKSDVKSANDKFTITASNVTAEWAELLADIDWRGCPIVVRKVPFRTASLTADDCVVLFSGVIDFPRVTLTQVTFSCSNDLGNLNMMVPRWSEHASCRFKWADDFCTMIRYKTENYAAKTVTAGSTTTLVKSTGLTEDDGTNGSYGTDRVDALANASITTSSEQAGFEGYRVKTSNSSNWRLGSTGADWGTTLNGYWQIPDAQAGLKNELLKPYIQFDFGSARTLKLWRFTGLTGGDRTVIPRLVQIFSSTNNIAWVFESYFELGPVGGTYYDAHIPKATNCRYWRVCVRNRWGESWGTNLFEKVQAYTDGRNWWSDGRLTFGAATATVALRGLTVPVLESYSGEVVVPTLPATPAIGDTFVIERGCPRTFNGCAHRGNTENYGGLDSLPFEALPR